MKVKFNRRWEVGTQLGEGGFGRVFVATDSDGTAAVAKFVRKAPGAERELLFVRLDNVRNVVPVIDFGETREDWVLVMPRADRSLRDELRLRGRLPLDSALAVLRDIATALADMEGRVVHRDLKPENVLLLRDTWCLADFGISRYAEASTAPDTRKFAMSPPYAAPERWRAERATIAADVYALGVIAVELLTGQRPFPGPSVEDYREQHLHAEPGRFDVEPPGFAALLKECLYKAPRARPSPARLLASLDSAAGSPGSPAASRLGQVHDAEVERRGARQLADSGAQAESERREELFVAARDAFTVIAQALLNVVKQAAPSIDVFPLGPTLVSYVRDIPLPSRIGWMAKLRQATLSLDGPQFVARVPWQASSAPVFDLIAYGEVKVVHLPFGPWMRDYGHAERSHSLYFCDAVDAGTYMWFETAFMRSTPLARDPSTGPFALGPGADAARALRGEMADYQVAWPFTPLSIGDLGDFVERWVGWFADALEGRLAPPSQMPERPVDGTWRRN